MNRLYLGAFALLAVIALSHGHGHDDDDDKKKEVPVNGLDTLLAKDDAFKKNYVLNVATRMSQPESLCNLEDYKCNSINLVNKSIGVDTQDLVKRVQKQIDNGPKSLDTLVREAYSDLELLQDSHVELAEKKLKVPLTDQQKKDLKFMVAQEVHEDDDLKYYKKQMDRINSVHHLSWSREEWEEHQNELPDTSKYAHNGLHPAVKAFLHNTLKIVDPEYHHKKHDDEADIMQHANEAKVEALKHSETEAGKYYKEHPEALKMLKEHKHGVDNDAHSKGDQDPHDHE